MRIESGTVENHRFGLARRRGGYDPTEVDAVMSRVADTLAQYERMIKRLEERLDASDPTTEELTRSTAAAQTSKARLVGEAKTAAAQIVETASEEAKAIRHEAEITAARIIGAADDHLSAAQMDAQRIREEADSHIDLAQIRAEELRTQADAILTSAISDAEQLSEEADIASVIQAAEAEKMLHFAQAEANRLATEARQAAEVARADTDAQVADVLAQARQQAQAMINSAVEETRLIREKSRADIDGLRETKKIDAEALIKSARNEAAEIRAAAAATAEAMTAQARADVEDLLGKARTDSLERLTAAQAEAEELLMEAGHEADAMVLAAREDARRLEGRVAKLQAAVLEFEAHIANLAEVAGDRTGLIAEMIDQETRSAGRTPRVRPNVTSGPGAPAIPPRKKSKRAHSDAALAADTAEPDGSGQLPANRPLVTNYSNPWQPTKPELRDEDTDEPEEFVYDGEASRNMAPSSGLEPLSEDAVDDAEGSDVDTERTTSTIYQRRGGGIKRRVAAIRTVESDRL